VKRSSVVFLLPESYSTGKSLAGVLSWYSAPYIFLLHQNHLFNIPEVSGLNFAIINTAGRVTGIPRDLMLPSGHLMI